ncbi:MAG: hypothetical protein LUD41_07765 [Phascolarctobacterium sp.]|nr:hypothetical protein [Phascolarctobacterium sp.]
MSATPRARAAPSIATGDGSSAVIGNIKGNFINNDTSDDSGNSDGGAIFNEALYGGVTQIGDITGNFVGNAALDYAESQSPTVSGGAIFNQAYNMVNSDTGDEIGSTTIIGDITGCFYGNSAHATSGGNSHGGAIHNAAGVEGTSESGYVVSSIEASIGNITWDFVGNCSESDESAAAWGGAIDNHNEGAYIGSI